MKINRVTDYPEQKEDKIRRVTYIVSLILGFTSGTLALFMETLDKTPEAYLLLGLAAFITIAPTCIVNLYLIEVTEPSSITQILEMGDFDEYTALPKQFLTDGEYIAASNTISDGAYRIYELPKDFIQPIKEGFYTNLRIKCKFNRFKVLNRSCMLAHVFLVYKDSEIYKQIQEKRVENMEDKWDTYLEARNTSEQQL